MYTYRSLYVVDLERSWVGCMIVYIQIFVRCRFGAVLVDCMIVYIQIFVRCRFGAVLVDCMIVYIQIFVRCRFGAVLGGLYDCIHSDLCVL